MSWLDRFFDSYYRHRPVNATFIGVHEYDHALPDLSESGAGDTLADMRSLLRDPPVLADATAVDSPAAGSAAAGPADTEITDASEIAEIDRRLAEGFLRIQIQEYESEHFHRGNPGFTTGEAVFGVMSPFLSDYAPMAQRTEAAIERMRAVPTLLAQGRANLRSAPREWTERAVRECEGALAFLSEGVTLIAADPPVGRHETPHGRGPAAVGARLDPGPRWASRLHAAADVAAAAFVEFREFLDSTLRASTREFRGCGAEALNLYLREGHFLDATTAEIVAYAEHEMAEAASRLTSGAAELSAADSAAALAGLEELHPELEDYLGRYQQLWDATREIARAHDVVTWPDFPLRYVPRYEWARGAAPYLYFLFYRSPAAFNRPAVHDYLVTPIEASMPAERQRQLLRANNDSVIKLNHVIHHGGIGHHVQNWHAFHSDSRIGRVAAVDCASRIAMFCGGTMAEGWACYATDLMAELGALTPLERYSLNRDRVRMCARAIVDVRLHEGRWSLREARRFYEREAGFHPDAARAEAVKNSMFPGAALMYLAGTDAIHELRRDMESAQGERFDLGRFHDTVLSYGSIPVSLVARAMRRTTSQHPRASSQDPRASSQLRRASSKAAAPNPGRDRQDP